MHTSGSHAVFSGWFRLCVPALMALAFACAPQAAPATPATAPAPGSEGAAGATAQQSQGQTSGRQLLDDLIAQARQEGALVGQIQSSWTSEISPELAAGFNQFYGLNLNVSLTPISSDEAVSGALAEAKAGAPATYDAMISGTEAESAQYVAGEAAHRVDNWETLLGEVNSLVRSGRVKAEQISKGPLEGHAFLFAGYLKQLLYNKNLISPQDLPAKHADLGDPRYQGKFIQPPWTSHWDIAPAVIDVDRQAWVDVVRQAGKNSGAVLAESAGVERVLLGEFAFEFGQDTYVRRTLQKDPSAPLGFAFFKDYNPYTGVYAVVRARAKHPAAGTLFALWMTTPEAEAIWQPATFLASPYGESQVDQDQANGVEAAGVPVTNFLDTPKTVELLSWYRTAEGNQYLESLAKAIKGQ